MLLRFWDKERASRMLKLQIEELEARQLLNGSSFAPGRLPLQPSAAVPYANWATEHLPFADYRGQVDLFGWGWPGEGGTEVVRLRSVVFAVFDGRGPDPRGLRAIGRQVPPNDYPSETSGNGIAWAAADHPGAGPQAGGGSETARFNAG